MGRDPQRVRRRHQFHSLQFRVGLLGNIASVQRLPAELPVYLIAVLLGAAVGTALGIKRLPAPMILKALGVLLASAGLKLIFT